MTRDERFHQIAKELGYGFHGEIKVGGNYNPLVQHENTIYISGKSLALAVMWLFRAP